MHPFADVPLGHFTTAGEVVVNVVTSLSPSVVRLFDLDCVLAETAPEMSVAVAAFSTCVKLFFENTLIRNLMLFRKMVSEALATMANLVTKFARIGLCAIAYPCLKLIVLDALMSLPVVLTSECLCTVDESTSVWFRMSFLVLPRWDVSKYQDVEAQHDLLEFTQPRERLIAVWALV